jgi:signal transduction histidine kinase/ligand-binding sensor domain-containing protein/CheY-like chemotaxis protein
MKGVIIIVFLLYLALLSWPLDQKKDISLYIHESWETDDGLPQNSILDIVQTSDGYLWMGTYEGLVRFDGVRFVVFNKSNTPEFTHNSVMALLEDSKGNLWVGTNGGGLLKRKNGRFYSITINDGLTSNHITDIFEDRRGVLWICTSRGISQLKNDRIEKLTTSEGLSNNNVWSVCDDREGNIWIATDGGGVNCMSKEGIRVYGSANVLGNDSTWDVYYSEIADDLWVCTSGAGLYRFHKGKWTNFTQKDGLASNDLSCVFQDSDNNLWIGSYKGGLSRFANGKFSVFNEKMGLTNNFVKVIYEDKEGSLWIGTYRGGLNRFRDGTVVTYSTYHGLSKNLVRSIFCDSRNNIWIGTTGGGLNKFYNDTFELFSTQTGLSEDRIWSICEGRDGSLWIGTYGGGVNRLKDGKITIFDKNNNLSHNVIRVVYEDSSGNLWVGTNGGGLDVFTNEKVVNYNQSTGLTGDFVYSILEDSRKNIWIGTFDGGLNRIDRDRHHITTFSKADGLSGECIWSLVEDDRGIIWMGTNGGGLGCYRDGKFKNYTAQDGLPSDTIFQIIDDKKGSLWMTSNLGVFKIALSEFTALNRGEKGKMAYTLYSRSDGMPVKSCNGPAHPAGAMDKKGRIWIPTSHGAVMISPEQKIRNEYTPPVIIEKLLVDNTEIAINSKILIPAGKKKFEIHYTGLSFLVPKKVKFKFILEGLDRDWTDALDRRVAYYSNVPPGSYTFRVIACNNDGKWNRKGASIHLALKPYFYQTTFFYGFVLFFLFLTGFIAYRTRVYQLRKREKRLAFLVGDRTKELAARKDQLEKINNIVKSINNEVDLNNLLKSVLWETFAVKGVEKSTALVYDESLDAFKYRAGIGWDVRNLEHLTLSCKEVEEQYLKDAEAVSDDIFITKKVSVREGEKEKRNTHWEIPLTTLIIRVRAENKIAGYLIFENIQDKNIFDNRNIQLLKSLKDHITSAFIKAKLLLELKTANDEAEKERKAAEAANLAKSNFLARMSHEIRTPMNSVIGFTDLLMETDLSEVQADFTRAINQSGNALLSLIDDILDLSKIEAGQLILDTMDFDPALVAFDVCESILPRIGAKPIEVLFRIGERVPPFVRGDAGRFRQVLTNLVGNSVKFTDKGEIELSIDADVNNDKEEDQKIKLHSKVRDTGIGIPKDKLAGIFEIFHQADVSISRKYKGTGLGLSICLQIARLMGGNVWVESKSGKGSTFHFTAWMEKSKNKRIKKVTYKHLSGKKVLIVGSNQHTLDILESILVPAELRVVTLQTVDDVIPTLMAALKKGDPFDLCIIDIQTHDLSGCEKAREIRSLDNEISSMPLLAHSSYIMKGTECLKESHFDNLLPKPFQKHTLLEMVSQLAGEERISKDKIRRELISTQQSIAEDTKRSVNILMAEDNLLNQKLVQHILSTADYRLVPVNNGREVVEKYLSAPEQFDLILMDIQMPEMDGIEATKIIREQGYKSIPIIALTAETMKGDRQVCLAAGMNDYISKPLKKEVVYGKVRKWLKKIENPE